MEIGRWIARAVAARLRCVRRGGRHPAAAAAAAVARRRSLSIRAARARVRRNRPPLQVYGGYDGAGCGWMMRASTGETEGDDGWIMDGCCDN